MSLLETLRNDMITATKAGDSDTNKILKLILASIKNAQIASDTELTDADVEKLLRKETKKIEDSIAQYEKMGRDDLVASEKKDFEIVNRYLPELMSEDKVREVVAKKIAETGAKDPRDMGRVMVYGNERIKRTS
jgi:uncharacterized protein YqeY